MEVDKDKGLDFCVVDEAIEAHGERLGGRDKISDLFLIVFNYFII